MTKWSNVSHAVAAGTPGCVVRQIDLRVAFDEADRRINAYAVSTTHAELARIHHVYWRAHRERFYRTVKLFSQHTDRWPRRILDVGSHYLQLACLLRCAGLEVDGCDVQEFAANPLLERRARDLGVRNRVVEPLSRLQRLPYGDGEFDVIFLLETIEHWNANPRVQLAELSRVLAPEGRLVITTPNFYGYHSIIRRVVRFLTGHGGYMPVSDLVQEGNLFHHWKEYSRKELSELLAGFGFHPRVSDSLTGAGDGTPAWLARLCRPWGQFLYVEYQR